MHQANNQAYAIEVREDTNKTKMMLQLVEMLVRKQVEIT